MNTMHDIEKAVTGLVEAAAFIRAACDRRGFVLWLRGHRIVPVAPRIEHGWLESHLLIDGEESGLVLRHTVAGPALIADGCMVGVEKVLWINRVKERM